jgi:hypothetical protein
MGTILGDIILKEDEISEVFWVSENELDDFNFFPMCKEKIKDSFLELDSFPKSFL